MASITSEDRSTVMRRFEAGERDPDDGILAGQPDGLTAKSGDHLSFRPDLPRGLHRLLVDMLVRAMGQASPARDQTLRG